jgi:hypothetical protein
MKTIHKDQSLPGKFHRVVINIIHSNDPGMVIFKSLLLIAISSLGLLRLIITFQLLQPPFLYYKDILQEYVLGRALLAGVDPYLPLPFLVGLFLGDIPTPVLPHPTPHPPPVSLFSIPLAMLTYQQAAAIWLLVELACLAWVAYRLSEWSGKTSRTRWFQPLIIFFLLLILQPVWEELIYGQLMIVMLVLFVETWVSIRNNRPIRAGIFLGLAVSIKLIAWPMLVYLLLKKQWKSAFVTMAIVILLNFASGMIMGVDQLIHYYGNVTKEVYAIYRGFNYSSSSLGWRLFEGTGTDAVPSIHALPLIDVPVLAGLSSMIFPLMLLLIGLVISSKARCVDTSVSVILVTVLLISPIVWYHYYVIAILPIGIVIRHYIKYGLSILDTFLLIGACSILLIPNAAPQRLIYRLMPSLTEAGNENLIPFSLSIITYIFPFLLLGLLLLLYRMDKKEKNKVFLIGDQENQLICPGL